VTLDDIDSHATATEIRHLADEAAFRELVLLHAENLPPQQHAIADYLLEHLQVVPFLSIPELARRTGASEATVVRFAQRIGYDGFSDLKMALVEILQQRLGPEPAPPEIDVDGDVLESVATLETANIRRSVDGLDRSVFAAVAEAVFSADHTYTFGLGVSAHLAELTAYTLTQIGIRATPLSTRFSSPVEQAVALRHGDLLLVLSFPPYSRQTLDLLDAARERGATTLAFTDRLTSPAARRARLVLPVRSDNMMFTNAIAAVTVVLNALSTEIATRHRGEAIDAISHINRVLADDPDVVGDDG
jgi:DNA-binding MurR/RpiR family transcriptional regulator